MTNQSLTAYKKEILDIFPDADLSLIKEVIYLDSWSSYEEFGGLLIFIGIDDSVQKCDYGYCVMAENNENLFLPQEITLAVAAEEIADMKHAISQSSLNF